MAKATPEEIEYLINRLRENLNFSSPPKVQPEENPLDRYKRNSSFFQTSPMTNNGNKSGINSSFDWQLKSNVNNSKH